MRKRQIHSILFLSVTHPLSHPIPTISYPISYPTPYTPPTLVDALVLRRHLLALLVVSKRLLEAIEQQQRLGSRLERVKVVALTLQDGRARLHRRLALTSLLRDRHINIERADEEASRKCKV
jgi:hypothetical protein